ncbi:hypothetical protein BGW36DRAFT_291250 [Talaromyces proteolyticus]|uniref:C2H2-type domain-containing protein n=1 Tax=Talaromyces proteolyticus TaxID=1131652 RepID=A0AAD4KVB7_9EURO|nr:uncharacterized protein BGW36DRAFT_291250 [Talaromyces proteolyticus]KAH8700644.1 hypothetical protein BGW36DRAFT_291250 [Talaromyces proteolyticus]
MLSDVYDSDDALNRSPVLKPAVINYGPVETIPPFQHKRSPSGEGKRDGSSSPDSSEGRSRKHHRIHKEIRPTLGDSVLIGILDPNRPDIARQAGENPLRSDSESDDDSRRRVKVSSQPNVTASEVASHALNIMPPQQPRPNTILPSINELVSHELHFSQNSFQRRPSERLISDQDSLAASRVGKYAISPSSMPAQEILPALQSPPHSAAGSPENSQILPSMNTVLRDLSSVAPSPFSVSAASPPIMPASVRQRQMSGPLPPPSLTPSQMPTPYSHSSPTSMKDMTGVSPAPHSQYAYRPPGLKSEMSNMSFLSESTPMAAPAGKSPINSYPTPTETKPTEEGSEVAVAGGNVYKCQYPGCTAAAFQTQYLLNSHANVHSQDRPHYCPVPGCPRGVSGKGFKRKNEMIRHGLVHDSPGYVCPFCTDQQHKYPRPDNLQRHVKAHHLDKDKDDPELRMVLAQRPKGSGRGRRRRGHT